MKLNDKNPAQMADDELFRQVKSWFELEHMRQSANRYQMALDCDYYDGMQWLPSEAAEVRRRGQNPIVFNEIKPTLDWLIGTERRTRRDFKVLARNERTDEAQADAEVKTKLLKYLEDVNRAPFERSQAFDDAVKAGMGWLEVGITSDPEDEPVFQRSESWRNMLHDSVGTTKPDLSDSRYLFRFKEVDLDVALAYFPDKEEELKRAATLNGGHEYMADEWHGAWPTARVGGREDLPMRWIQYNPEADILNPRRRVSLVECWYRAPTRERRKEGGTSQDRTKMVMHVAVFTKFDLLVRSESPYKHNKFPFVPLWCYRRKSDGLPYGVVRNVRGPQDDLNKRMSKAQFVLSINQLRMEKSAVDAEVMDEHDLRVELARPDGVAIFADGALSGNKVQVREHGDIAQGHLALADRDAMAIRSVSGVTMENRGESSPGSSGKAILAKQDQGQMVTAEVFDNMLHAHQLEGELVLSLIEQFYTEQKTFSITGERYKLDYSTINEVDPATGQPINPVYAHKAAFVIGEAPWRQALAEAAFESAMQMLGQLAPVAPNVVTAIIDLVFEWSDLPNKNEILRRIRGVTGMPDPDEGETPEMQAQKAQQQQMQAAQFEAEMAGIQAQIKEAQAKGEKLDAEAMAKRLEALYMAAQGAQVIAANPLITPVADELLKSAGFVDRAGQGVIDPAVVQQAPAVLPMQEPMPDQVQEQMQEPLQEPLQADGAMQGIETPRADGLT